VSTSLSPEEEQKGAPKVLVVEDEMLIGMDLVMLLEEWGCSATGPVRTVASALSAVEAQRPDVAILDVNLGDGETSIPIAMELAESGIPFAFLTGYDPSRLDDGATALKAPFLRKPVNERELREVLSQLVPRSTTAG
jgi:CheY-like chemotaxis protein